MNRISIIDIDSKIPNLALKKVEKYHKDKGDEVEWNDPFFTNISDKIYVSCIFSWNKDKTQIYEKKALIGGSGYSLSITLPKEIDEVKPRINMGFATRGCIRKCPFCIVPVKEGNIRVEGDIYDIWDGIAKKITLLDNNILALPKHFKQICFQLKKEKLTVDFNQGLDCRLLNQDIMDDMKSIAHAEYKFAFDNPNYKPAVEKAIDLLQKNNINRCMWYVLVGFNTAFEEDLDRMNYLKSRNQNVFVQRYETCKSDKKYTALARWGNQHHIFQGMTWEQFLNHSENKKYYKDLMTNDLSEKK